MNVNPSISSLGDKGVVAWFSREQSSMGEKRALYVQSFRQGFEDLKLGEAQIVAEIDSLAASALPGAPGLVALGGDYYFVAYQDKPAGEQTSADATSLKGRFLKIAPPAE